MTSPSSNINVHTALKYVREQLSGRVPLVGIVLGSGLGRLGEQLEDSIIIPYATIPGFPVSTAPGHKGNLICGMLGGKCVLAMQGRFHYYEGYPMSTVTIGVRLMKLLGIEYLFVSNAAGGCNPGYRKGDMVIIKDHISFFPNPLIGPNDEDFGPRFPDLSCAYDLDLRKMAHSVAEQLGFSMVEGTYFGSTGPSFETPAEVRFYRMIGADLLGMSTIPEVITARHCGIKVFGVSVVTNISNLDTDNIEELNDPQDVNVQADKVADRMTTLFATMISKL